MMSTPRSQGYTLPSPPITFWPACVLPKPALSRVAQTSSNLCIRTTVELRGTESLGMNVGASMTRNRCCANSFSGIPGLRERPGHLDPRTGPTDK